MFADELLGFGLGLNCEPSMLRLAYGSMFCAGGGGGGDVCGW